MWRTLRNHPFMAVAGLLFLVAAFLAVAPLFTGSQQRASLMKKQADLRGAYREFTNSGSITAFRDIWLSSNTVAIGNTQYQCFVEARYGGGTLAMTTNLTFIWFGPNKISKIISNDYPRSRQ